ncbi:Zinc-binding dehydrogenase-like protein 12 [Elsinoe fawcettii]|nr:Zinc-binding dehydrogenase-like protein 12 [Elsinoe fawcettii]
MSVQTEALVVDKPGSEFKLTAIRLDAVRDDEVLVEMLYTGICHTDLSMQKGLLPFTEFPAIFGHEGAGIVKAIGANPDNNDIKVGDHVIMSPLRCTSCRPCLDDSGRPCRTQPNVNFTAVRLTDGTSPASLLDGTSVRSQFFGQSSFSKHAVVARSVLVKCPFPESLPYYAALGCSFQTGAGAVYNNLKPDQNSSIVIFGLGSVGMAALMAAAHLKLRQIIAVDIVDSRLKLASSLGATHVVNSLKVDNIVSHIKSLTDDGADYAVECSGVSPVIQSSVDCLGVGGRAISLGIPAPTATVTANVVDMIFANKSYSGSTGGSAPAGKFLPTLMQWHREGTFPVDRICRVYPIKKFQEAVEDLKKGTVLKPVIQWSE